MLFRRDARHGLEPVGKVSRALLHRPVLHGVGDDVRNAHVERVPEADGLDERFIGLLGETLLHDLTVEDVGRKDPGDIHHTYLRAGK